MEDEMKNHSRHRGRTVLTFIHNTSSYTATVRQRGSGMRLDQPLLRARKWSPLLAPPLRPLMWNSGTWP